MEKLKEYKGFKLYTKKPNTISKGALYTKEIYIEGDIKDNNRLIRVYLPSNYDFNNPDNRFPVMYMMDGKNLFDHHTSFVGEWHVDETIEKYVKQNGKGMIVVGIDSAIDGNDRRDEMLIKAKAFEKKTFGDEILNPKGEIIADYIFDVLKPMIDETFFTKPDRENTAVGGSSMGGLYSFYMGTKYKEQVAFSLCFTPAFAFYKKSLFIKELKKHIKFSEGFGKYFFFVGGIGLEKVLEPLTTVTYKHLASVGFDEKQARYIYDSAQVHNEEPWSFYYDVAIKWWGILEK